MHQRPGLNTVPEWNRGGQVCKGWSILDDPATRSIDQENSPPPHIRHMKRFI